MLIRREDFGPIEAISKGSHKKIWFTCEKCGMGVLQSYRNYNKQNGGKFCRPCRNKHTANRPDVIEKKSIASKELWENPEYREKTCRSLTEAKLKEWRENYDERVKHIHNRKSDDEIIEMLELEGYTLIEVGEMNSRGRNIKVECPRGHRFETKVSKWNWGHRCYQCYLEVCSENAMENHSDWSHYYFLVKKETEKTYKEYKHILDPEGKRGRDYHLDHIYSISEGFLNDMPIEVMSSVHNLRMMNGSDNISKGADCHITKEELLEKCGKV